MGDNTWLTCVPQLKSREPGYRDHGVQLSALTCMDETKQRSYLAKWWLYARIFDPWTGSIKVHTLSTWTSATIFIAIFVCAFITLFIFLLSSFCLWLSY